jgi:inositol oxygenase
MSSLNTNEAILSLPGRLSTLDIKTNDKEDDAFRCYDLTKTPQRVIDFYRTNRTKQTSEFVARMKVKFGFTFNKETGENEGRKKMTVAKAFEELKNYVDASDPDLEDLPNLIHLLQTAEGIRKAGHPEWFVLTGLLHDMGKIMFLWGDDETGQNGRDPHGQQWALGGDTFVVGCPIPDQIVFPEFNHLNPDSQDPVFSTPNGIYKAKCGLKRLNFSWGHDEYMYRMLFANNTSIPPEGLAMIRYHSAYCWHTGGAYQRFETQKDLEMKEWVREFNQFDLYTKDEGNKIDPVELWPYYFGLLRKFGLGGELWW